MPFRILAATVDSTVMNATKPQKLAAFARSVLKFPVEYRAAAAQQGVPVASFNELFGPPHDLDLSVDSAALNRHGWNVKLHEEVYLSAAVLSGTILSRIGRALFTPSAKQPPACRIGG